MLIEVSLICEQTSALDTHTEQALLQNIRSILTEKARTSVFVAHRLRTIYDADMIIVLKDGQVAESGTHSELISKNGLYADLWNGKPFFNLYTQFACLISTVAQETTPEDAKDIEDSGEGESRNLR